jgi:hypothetical protein
MCSWLTSFKKLVQERDKDLMMLMPLFTGDGNTFSFLLFVLSPLLSSIDFHTEFPRRN